MPWWIVAALAILAGLMVADLAAGLAWSRIRGRRRPKHKLPQPAAQPQPDPMSRWLYGSMNRDDDPMYRRRRHGPPPPVNPLERLRADLDDDLGEMGRRIEQLLTGFGDRIRAIEIYLWTPPEVEQLEELPPPLPGNGEWLPAPDRPSDNGR